MADLKDDIKTLGDFLRRQYHDVMSPEAEQALDRIASAVGELEHLREAARLLPLTDTDWRGADDATLSAFCQSKAAWNRAERARKAAAEPGKLTPQQLMDLPETGQCEKVCDHGSRCFLPNNHLPRGRHESNHGCIFYDTTRELEAKLAEARHGRGRDE